jgi:cyclase
VRRGAKVGTLRAAWGLLLLGSTAAPARAQAVAVQELAPGVLVLTTPAGNSIASVGPDGAVVVGVQSPLTTAGIEAELARRTRSPRRYVVLAPGDSGVVAGDAGWSALGATVIAHENTRPRLQKWAGAGANVTLPIVTYSEVIAFDLNGGSVHVVHMPPGYSDGDAIAHFHHADVIHLGASLTTDGYPHVDLAQNGSIDGIIETVGRFTDSPATTKLVPRRGPIIHAAELEEYHAMLVAIRDSVRALAKTGMSEERIVAARPTARWDSRWGKGRITPDQFVRMVFRSKPAA